MVVLFYSVSIIYIIFLFVKKMLPSNDVRVGIIFFVNLFIRGPLSSSSATNPIKYV